MTNNIRNVGSPGKIYWKKYREKINTDTINWQKLFGRSADHKKFNIPRLVNFNHVFYVISSMPVFLD